MDDQMALYRKRAKERHEEHQRRLREEEQRKAIEILRRRAEEFLQWQREGLLGYGFTAEQAHELLWSFEDLEDIMLLGGSGGNSDRHEDGNDYKNCGIDMPELFMVKFRTENGTIHTQCISKITHLARFQGMEPPLYKASPVTQEDWKRVVRRWRLVGPGARGIRALAAFRFMRVEVAPDESTATGATQDALSESEFHYAHFAFLESHLANLWAEEATGRSGVTVLEIVSESARDNTTVYVPVGNPVRRASGEGVVRIDRRLAARVGWGHHTGVQVRAVSLPTPRGPPEASIFLQYIGCGDGHSDEDSQVSIGRDLTPAHIQVALEKHNILCVGQEVRASCPSGCAVYRVNRLVGERGPCPAMFVGGHEVGIDIAAAPV